MLLHPFEHICSSPASRPFENRRFVKPQQLAGLEVQRVSEHAFLIKISFLEGRAQFNHSTLKYELIELTILQKSIN
ncbi:hypothetical protein THAOC_04596 [Thalassiosira oceanica]|uniref:Uncharacterized protein n=1 Tax=Thalassiosira oceanica TaxID=159749 RepID=K0TNS6_THAOC|nr:hypothetical protein THAOC_04596 [Thalassiosira oceanica]|eukprot:EJK73762.1 hypothetical protein THAOC_04596 [Thalassiosira oceanica]